MINVLLIGDIVGSPGRAILKQALPKILRQRAIDYCIANAENLAGGNVGDAQRPGDHRRLGAFAGPRGAHDQQAAAHQVRKPS